MAIKIFLMKKFINLLMIAGKKHTAHTLFFAAGFQFLHLIERDKNKPIRHATQPKNRVPSHTLRKKKKSISECNRFLLRLHTVIKHVQPSLEGKKCRVAGTTKIVPAIISQERGYALAMRWIIQSAKNRKKSSQLPLHQCLAQEFMEAYQRQGRPRLRREECHKICEGNRGFLRYRWW